MGQSLTHGRRTPDLMAAPKRGLVEGGPQAGLKALYTCTSWYAYAAMFGSSKRSLIRYKCATIQITAPVGLVFSTRECLYATKQ